MNEQLAAALNEIRELRSAYESALLDKEAAELRANFLDGSRQQMEKERDEARADDVKCEAARVYISGLLEAEREKSAKLVEALRTIMGKKFFGSQARFVAAQALSEYESQKSGNSDTSTEHVVDGDSPVKSEGDLQNVGPERPGQEVSTFQIVLRFVNRAQAEQFVSKFDCQRTGRDPYTFDVAIKSGDEE